MQPDGVFHHYKGNALSKSEKVERKVVALLLASDVPDSERESSITWELKHSSGCCQLARILAMKRGLDPETAEVAAVLHDIYVIITGTYQDHARRGAPLAEEILNEVGGYTQAEIRTITQAVYHHSEKEVHSDEPYVELTKDVDVFDCSLYKGAEAEYRRTKSENAFNEYANRVRKVRKELGMDTEHAFRK